MLNAHSSSPRLGQGLFNIAWHKVPICSRDLSIPLEEAFSFHFNTVFLDIALVLSFLSVPSAGVLSLQQPCFCDFADNNVIAARLLVHLAWQSYHCPVPSKMVLPHFDRVGE